jgi:nitric oxide reductase large subunit
MLHILALFYGLLVMYVINCASRNVRANRAHPRALTLVGLSTMAVSLIVAALLLAVAAGLVVVIFPAT